MKRLLTVLCLFPSVALASGEVTVSFTQTSGNSDTDTLALSYQVERELSAWELSSKGDYLYKRDSGKETANRLNLEGVAGRKLSDRLLLELYGFAFRDPFSGYDFRGGLGPGLSWKVSKDFTLSGRLTYTYNDFTGGGSSTYSQAELKGDYTRKLTSNLTFEQSLSYQLSLKDEDDYFIHSRTTFKVPFSRELSLNISYRVDYQNLLPDDARYHTDKTFLVGVSYRF